MAVPTPPKTEPKRTDWTLRVLLLGAGAAVIVAAFVLGREQPDSPAAGREDEASATSATTAAAATSAEYRAAVRAAVAEADQIAGPQDLVARDDRWAELRDAYRGLARTLEDIDPPTNMTAKHNALISAAEAVADRADEAAADPPDIDNLAPAFDVSDERERFQLRLASL